MMERRRFEAGVGPRWRERRAALWFACGEANVSQLIRSLA